MLQNFSNLSGQTFKGRNCCLERNFSLAAGEYDLHGDTHREIYKDLFAWSKMDLKRYLFICEVGMGTGWGMEYFINNFPQSKYFGIDLALGMVRMSHQRLSLNGQSYLGAVQGDAEHLPFLPRTANLILSTGVYHWCNDLERAFGESAKILQEGGIFLGSCFGKKTLIEIREVLERTSLELNYPYASQSPKFPEKENLLNALKIQNFKNIQIEERFYYPIYSSPLEGFKAMRSLGVLGAEHPLKNHWRDGLFLKTALRHLTQREIAFTFHVWFWKGEKP